MVLLLSQLGYWHSNVLARLTDFPREASPIVLPPEAVPVVPEYPRAVPDLPDRMLTVAQACHVCGRSRSFLYEHSEELGFGHRAMGVRGLRISEQELRHWMRGK